MKVLVSAYACDPAKGSEPGAGWAWVAAAARSHDVWVLTRRNNASSIEQALGSDPSLRITPVYLDLPPRLRWWKRGRRGVRTYYLVWQLLALRAAKRLHGEVGFDLAHHLTFAMDWLPAATAWLGIPHVWGPVGGAARAPTAMWRWMGWRGAAREVARVGQGSLGRATAGRMTASRSTVVIAQNPAVAHAFRHHRWVIVRPNVVVDSNLTRVPPKDHSGPPTAVFAGELRPLKGLALAIAALAEPELTEWRLRIFGSGSDRRRCQSMAERLGVTDRIQFEGSLPREKYLKELVTADAMLMPSLHDQAGWAVAEACELGLPVVCIDVGGPPVVIQGSSGTAVPPTRDAPQMLASALSHAVQGTPAHRWTTDHLQEFLKTTYEASVLTEQRVPKPSGALPLKERHGDK